MRVFAIADLHMSGGSLNKSMDIFGQAWQNHMQKISSDWQSRVSNEDLVLIPGDISWAMSLEQAYEDLKLIDSLNGTKVLLKGNHDFWWSSLTRIKSLGFKTLNFLQNNSFEFGDIIVGGTRGWNIPILNNNLPENELKIYNRELIRLNISLNTLQSSDKYKIVMCHYPPLFSYYKHTELAQLFTNFKIKQVVYGHLHGDYISAGFNGVYNDVNYHLVSCDSLNFKLKEITIK